MVCKRIHFKEYYFIKQGLYKLETEEAKMGFNLIVVETADTLIIKSLFLMVHSSLLADLFFLSFFLLLTA